MISGLYIHIPFCDYICTYCDFAKVYSDTMKRKTRYLDALAKEFLYYSQKCDMSSITTVYFGGGTPSALTLEELAQLMAIFKNVLSQAKEITFEANPDSLTEEKIKLLASFGVNRMSIGVQTFDPKQLHLLGRKHDLADIERCISALINQNIINYNLDIIYALPEQTLEQLEYDLDRLTGLCPAHISAYALIVEPHTKLFLDMERARSSEIPDVLQEQMYYLLQDKLAFQGYDQYEVSNWSKPNFTSAHNSGYWERKEYVGIGLGSHSYVDNMRYSNTRSLPKYLHSLEKGEMPIKDTTILSLVDHIEESLFLGLRLLKGVSLSQFEQEFGVTIEQIYGPIIQKYILQNILEKENDYIRLHQKAIFTSNTIFSDLLLTKEQKDEIYQSKDTHHCRPI